jgi:hypothetical protein
MKMYYYAVGQNQFGPVALEELPAKGIHLDTLIWHEGLEGWLPARNLPEVAALLSPVQPHVPPIPPQLDPSAGRSTAFTGQGRGPLDAPTRMVPPKSYLLESILATLLCCLPFGIAGIVNAAKVESRWMAGDQEGALRASRAAKQWMMISFWIGLVIFLLYFLGFLAAALLG